MEVTSCPRGYRHAAVRPAAAHRRTRGTGSSGRTKFRRHLVRRPRGERACAVGLGTTAPGIPCAATAGFAHACRALLPGCYGNRVQAQRPRPRPGAGTGAGPSTGSEGAKPGREPAARCSRSGGSGRALGRRQGDPRHGAPPDHT